MEDLDKRAENCKVTVHFLGADSGLVVVPLRGGTLARRWRHCLHIPNDAAAGVPGS